MSIHVFRTVVLLTIITLLAPSLWADDTALEAARHEYALPFFSVDAHVNLAKQQYEHGDRLQAFYCPFVRFSDHLIPRSPDHPILITINLRSSVRICG